MKNVWRCGWTCCWLLWTAAVGEAAYPPGQTLGEVREAIAAAPREHPRLLIDAAGFERLRQSLGEDPLKRRLADEVMAEAKRILATVPVTRTLEGRRLLGQSRRCLQRVVYLAMAYQLTGEEVFAGRAAEEMLAVAGFSDWNPSHFLDVAEMTMALAVGYDWLYEALEESARVTIRRAIVDKGVSLPFTTDHRNWVTARNNWGQVCHGGLTAGALAVMEDEPELAARTVHNAIHHVTHSMAAFAPKGSYPEGPGYWSYGTGYNVLLIAVLESVLGSDFGLSEAPGFSVTGEYPNLAGGPSGLFFNYADGGAGRGPEPFLFWFAARYGRPDWLLGERERMKGELDQLDRLAVAGGGDRFLPLALLWMRPEPERLDIRMPLHWLSEGSVPVSIHRSS